MPIRTVPGSDLQYYLIAFDKQGRERAEDDALLSGLAADTLSRESFTDVFIFSHGWQGDLPAAVVQYDAWTRAMHACAADVQRAHELRPGFRPLLVGFHWPSKAWGDEELGAGVAYAASAIEAGAAAGGALAPPTADTGTSSVDGSADAFVDAWADRIADTPAARDALRRIFLAARRDVEPARMPRDVVDAYLTLDRESGLGADGVAGAPDADRESFDPVAAYDDACMESTSFGGLELGGLLAPLRQLSFWQMKARARTVGENGGGALLAALRRAAPAPVRVHLMGHSFGCIVVSAMLIGADVAPVDTLFLVQGALSLWAYCGSIPYAPDRPGYFHTILRDHRVRGPIITTRSRFDTAVGRFYPLGAGLAGQVDYAPTGEPLPKYGGVGTFGLHGPAVDAEDLPMRDEDAAYPFRTGHVYNLDADAFICHGAGLSGAHSDIAQSAVAHAFWSAVLAAREEPAPNSLTRLREATS